MSAQWTHTSVLYLPKPRMLENESNEVVGELTCGLEFRGDINLGILLPMSHNTQIREKFRWIKRPWGS